MVTARHPYVSSVYICLATVYRPVRSYKAILLVGVKVARHCTWQSNVESVTISMLLVNAVQDLHVSDKALSFALYFITHMITPLML